MSLRSGFVRSIAHVVSGLVLGCAISAAPAHAQVTFDWTMDESGVHDYGTFITATGSAPGGMLAAGTYLIASWKVTNSEYNSSLNGKSLNITNPGGIIWDGTQVVGVADEQFTAVDADGYGYDLRNFPGEGIKTGWDAPGSVFVEAMAAASLDTSTAATPEPGAAALISAGTIVTLLKLRRRKKA